MTTYVERFTVYCNYCCSELGTYAVVVFGVGLAEVCALTHGAEASPVELAFMFGVGKRSPFAVKLMIQMIRYHWGLSTVPALFDVL